MDVSRFPQGVLITGDLTTVRPVGTIVYHTVTNAFYRSTNGSVATYQAIGPGSGGTIVSVTADPGITGQQFLVDKSYTVSLTNDGNPDTNGLAIPTFAGQEMLLFLAVAGGGTRTVTAASAINKAGNVTFKLAALGDFIKLEGYKLGAVLAWRVVANDGCAIP